MTVYSIKEVAGILHTNVEYVHKLRRAGILKVIKIGGYKVRSEALDEFLKAYEGMDVTDPENPKNLFECG